MCKDGKGSSIRINLKKAPSGRGYTKIYSTSSAFAALKANGLIKVWGDQDSGGRDAPTGKGYTKIYSTTLIEPLCVRTAKALLLE
jgi:hypothetical protein